jgi:hypothetical protein
LLASAVVRRLRKVKGELLRIYRRGQALPQVCERGRSVAVARPAPIFDQGRAVLAVELAQFVRHASSFPLRQSVQSPDTLPCWQVSSEIGPHTTHSLRFSARA